MLMPERVWLTQRDVAIPHNKGRAVTLAAIPRGQEPVADVVVRLAENETRLERFADVGVFLDPQTRHTTLLPHVQYVSLEGAGWPAVVVIGTVSIAWVNVAESSVREVLRLFRDIGRDTGFDNLSLVKLADGFIVMYEAGAARLDFNGSNKWHRELTLNDVFMRTDAESLYYWSDYPVGGAESDEGWFAVDLADGSVRRVTEAQARGVM